MAIQKIKTGRRGRPITIDTLDVLQDLVALQRRSAPMLEKLRRTSKGMRQEYIFGTRTSAPDWVQRSIDLLTSAEVQGLELTTQDVKSIRATTTALKRLGARQIKYQTTALEPILYASYVSDIQRLSTEDSPTLQRKKEEIIQKLENMTPQMRSEFLRSKYYQSWKARGNYERVRKWAKAKTGRSRMSMDEAWATLYADKIAQFENAHK